MSQSSLSGEEKKNCHGFRLTLVHPQAIHSLDLVAVHDWMQCASLRHPVKPQRWGLHNWELKPVDACVVNDAGSVSTKVWSHQWPLSASEGSVRVGRGDREPGSDKTSSSILL